jgi:hypothetical protein
MKNTAAITNRITKNPDKFTPVFVEPQFGHFNE